MNRSQRAGLAKQTRKGLWDAAKGDFFYVINHTPKDFVLLPEIYTRLGETELLLEQPQNAKNSFEMARKLKPDYWPAYSHWAEYLRKNGHREEALAIVKEGLKHSPQSKVLTELFKILGGKLGSPSEK